MHIKLFGSFPSNDISSVFHHSRFGENEDERSQNILNNLEETMIAGRMGIPSGWEFTHYPADVEEEPNQAELIPEHQTMQTFTEAPHQPELEEVHEKDDSLVERRPTGSLVQVGGDAERRLTDEHPKDEPVAEADTVTSADSDEILAMPLGLQNADETPEVDRLMDDVEKIVSSGSQIEEDISEVPKRAPPSAEVVPQPAEVGSPPAAQASPTLAEVGSPPSAETSPTLAEVGSPPSAETSPTLAEVGSPPSAETSPTLAEVGSPFTSEASLIPVEIGSPPFAEASPSFAEVEPSSARSITDWIPALSELQTQIASHKDSQTELETDDDRDERLEEPDTMVEFWPWAMGWFGYPWVLMLIFVIAVTIFSSAFNIDPAFVVLGVSIVSMISLQFLPFGAAQSTA